MPPKAKKPKPKSKLKKQPKKKLTLAEYEEAIADAKQELQDLCSQQTPFEKEAMELEVKIQQQKDDFQDIKDYLNYELKNEDHALKILDESVEYFGEQLKKQMEHFGQLFKEKSHVIEKHRRKQHEKIEELKGTLQILNAFEQQRTYMKAEEKQLIDEENNFKEQQEREMYEFDKQMRIEQAALEKAMNEQVESLRMSAGETRISNIPEVSNEDRKLRETHGQLSAKYVKVAQQKEAIWREKLHSDLDLEMLNERLQIVEKGSRDMNGGPSKGASGKFSSERFMQNFVRDQIRNFEKVGEDGHMEEIKKDEKGTILRDMNEGLMKGGSDAKEKFSVEKFMENIVLDQKRDFGKEVGEEGHMEEIKKDEKGTILRDMNEELTKGGSDGKEKFSVEKFMENLVLNPISDIDFYEEEDQKTEMEIKNYGEKMSKRRGSGGKEKFSIEKFMENLVLDQVRDINIEEEEGSTEEESEKDHEEKTPSNCKTESQPQTRKKSICQGNTTKNNSRKCGELSSLESIKNLEHELGGMKKNTKKVDSGTARQLKPTEESERLRENLQQLLEGIEVRVSNALSIMGEETFLKNEQEYKDEMFTRVEKIFEELSDMVADFWQCQSEERRSDIRTDVGGLLTPKRRETRLLAVRRIKLNRHELYKNLRKPRDHSARRLGKLKMDQ